MALSGDALDALCALGLQSRVVAAALPGRLVGSALLSGHDREPAAGRGQPQRAGPRRHRGGQTGSDRGLCGLDAAAVSATGRDRPDRVHRGAGAAWEDNLRGVAAATGRAGAADALIDDFTAKARETGAAHDAAHYQASIVQFTENTVRVYGSDNFPATVLTAVGLDRPPSQRFTDKPYIEMGASDADLARGPDFSAADADIVYVSFASPAAKDRAPALLDSDPWRKLSAYRDNRVFIVNNEVWQTGQGLIAARGIVDDLHWINAPIN